MNGKKAREIRKSVYGEGGSNRFRKYLRHKSTGSIIADEKRRTYQKLKKEAIEEV